MEIKKAKEKLGKLVSIRPEPSVGSGYLGFLWPGNTIEYVEIVDDLDDPNNKWLKRTNGTYVNFFYPPAGYRYRLLEGVIEYDSIRVLFLQDGVVVSEREFYDTRPTA